MFMDSYMLVKMVPGTGNLQFVLVNATGAIYKNGGTALDWVFDVYYDGRSSEAPEDYKLASISELAQFVKTNRHLPGLSKELYTGASVEVGALPSLLLQKQEEQTLYILELQEQIDALKAQVAILQPTTNLNKTQQTTAQFKFPVNS